MQADLDSWKKEARRSLVNQARASISHLTERKINEPEAVLDHSGSRLQEVIMATEQVSALEAIRAELLGKLADQPD